MGTKISHEHHEIFLTGHLTFGWTLLISSPCRFLFFWWVTHGRFSHMQMIPRFCFSPNCWMTSLYYAVQIFRKFWVSESDNDNFTVYKLTSISHRRYYKNITKSICNLQRRTYLYKWLFPPLGLLKSLRDSLGSQCNRRYTWFFEDCL